MDSFVTPFPSPASEEKPPPEQARPQRPDLNGRLILQNKAAEHHTNGKEALEKSQYEKAVICCQKALTLQPDQVQLHASQGEAYLQLCDFQSAAACYVRAFLLEPESFSSRLASIYFLQGQCLLDRGLLLEAMEAFNKAIQVKPGCRLYETKSLACMSALGHHTYCLKTVNDWMESDGPTSDLYILRARLQKLLNQTSRCYQDVKSSLALNPTCPAARALLLELKATSEKARQKAVERFFTDQLPESLCMIGVALENYPEDARLYLFRGFLYRYTEDFTAAIEDLIQVLELSEEAEKEATDSSETFKNKALFQLALTYNDFAVHCYTKGLFADAILLLNKAIDEEKGLAGLYLNRGDCFFQQREWHFALADYQQAEDMMPADDPALRLRLAVIHNTLGSFCLQDSHFREAANLFSLAIQYNPSVSLYYENRAKAFRKLSDFRRARQDFICLLILDPSNDEVSPMLMHLFPGCTMAAVLSSSEGKAVRVQLMDAIKNCGSSSDQPRLSETLKQMTLTGTSNQTEEPPQAGKKLK